MALPSSGPLSLNDIQTEFGGTNPIGLNEYYAGGGLVPAGTSGTNGPVPSSGAISIFNFYGTTAVQPFGDAQYTVAGTYTFIVPTGITSISAVCVGGGGGATDTGPFGTRAGGGGALSYSNGISTTPGESLTVQVGAGGVGPSGPGGRIGGTSSISRGGTTLLSAQGAQSNIGGAAANGVGAVKYSGGTNTSGATAGFGSSGAGCGAAGYAGDGGGGTPTPAAGLSGNGGGGGSGAAPGNTGGPGGGVGLVIQGASGAGGALPVGAGGGGSGGAPGTEGGPVASRSGGAHGGGGGGSADNNGGSGGVGGVRIIYGGTGKSYPNNSAP